MNDTGGVEQPRRYVAIFYVLAAVAFGFFLERVLALVFSYARVNDFAVVGDWSLSAVLGFGLAAVSPHLAVPDILFTNLEAAPLGIRVNAVCPGIIRTPMAKAFEDGGMGALDVEKFAADTGKQIQDLMDKPNV